MKRGANLKGEAPTYYFGQFPPKLRENEDNWTPSFPVSQRGNPEGRGAPIYYLGNFCSKNCMKMKKFWADGRSSPPLDT